jgi:hypothetical protein
MTAPVETSTELNFFMFGDTRTLYAWHDSVSAAMIGDYQNDPSFQTITVCTGDLVTYGAEESEWQSEFFTDLGPNTLQRLSEVPFVSCLGNHGLYYSNYSAVDMTSALFGKYFPYPYVERRYWSFDYGPVHFTIVDLYPDFYDPYGQGKIDDDQLAWIESDLNNTTKEWKIVVLHEPGWSAGGSSSGSPHPNNNHVQTLLQPLLEQYGVQVLQCGHNHYYAHAVKNGIIHLTAAGGGAPLYSPDPMKPNVMKTNETHHYCKASINGDNMNIIVLSPAGDTVDVINVMKNTRPNHLLGHLRKQLGPGSIEEAQIEVDGNVIHPDPSGYYGLELDVGSYEVSFVLDNYYPIIKQLDVFEGTETQFDTMMVLIPNPSTSELESPPPLMIIYPNPTSDIINLQTNKTGAMLEVRIFSHSGQMYLHKSGSYSTINVSDLPAGIYILEAKTESGVVRKKFVKR